MLQTPRRFVAAVALAASFCAALARPAETRAEAAVTVDGGSPDAWEFSFTPYVWLPAQSGTIGAGGKEASVDVGIMDSLDLMGDHLSLIAGFFHLEARKRRFFTFLDVTLSALDTGQDVTVHDPRVGAIDLAASLEQNVAIVELAAGYELLALPLPERTRPFVLQAFLGTRYYYFWTKVDVTGTNAQLGSASRTATGDLDWWDPMIGGRFAVPILEPLDLQVRGDIGGFDLGSELAWSMAGFLRYHFAARPLGLKPWLALGYKVLDFDWKDRSKSIDLNMAGPALALGATF
jgi:hypothetical protein